ncbi:MAG: response regulator [Acidobacteriaceae bacterium]
MMPQVLLVDDNPIQAVTRKAILERVGFTVKTFLSAKEALRFIENDVECAINMVITDHIMPEMSGTAFVCQLRELNSQVPVIVLSGMAEAEEEYEEYNVVFRTKPIAPDELQAMAIGLLDSPIIQTA